MYEENNYHSIPQPDEITEREKEDAMGGYFMMFASAAIGLPLPVFNLIAAIIYYYLHRTKSRFVSFHTLQSLLSQIPVTLLNLGAIVWIIRIFAFDVLLTDYFKGYVAMAIAANLIYFIFSIIGAVRSRKGRFYYFWFFGKWSFHLVYKIKAHQDDEAINLPPRF